MVDVDGRRSSTVDLRQTFSSRPLFQSLKKEVAEKLPQGFVHSAAQLLTFEPSGLAFVHTVLTVESFLFSSSD